MGFQDETITEIMNSCEQYRPKLIRYCSQFFQYEPEQAEDCVQEAYVALLEALQKGQKIRNCEGWLFKVVMNHKNKAVKEKIKQKSCDVSDAPLTYNPDYLDVMVGDAAIEQKALEILKCLSPQERDLYYDYYVEQKSLKAIAKKWGISYTAARQRSSTLRKKLLKMIKDREGEV